MLHRMPITVASALGVILSAPLAVADTPASPARTTTQEQIAERLDRFEDDAASMRADFDSYVAYLRNPNTSKQLHAYNLNSARDQVNSLGLQLDVLEDLSPHGTELQQAAIREVRPHLEAVADQVGIAIALHTENRHNLLSQDYRDVVNEMYESADNLYSKVDAITDYEKALDKADKARVLTLPDDV